MKFKIHLNDETILVDNQLSLQELVDQQNYLENNFAVALNRHFIARNQSATTLFKEGDAIELVAPMAGG